MDAGSILLAGVALALGGILKGATGAGSPIIAVPILALLYDVPFAVAIFTLPNLLSNIWQGWAYRQSRPPGHFAWVFAAAGAAGAGVGSVLLATLSADLLMAVVAFVVLGYIAFRLSRPNWVLSRRWMDNLAAPAGLFGGVLQGAGGISAPVSVTFLNAAGLPRAAFIATISLFFAAMSLVQIPMLSGLGILTFERAGISLIAAIPLFGFMPVGAALARRISPQTFNTVILILLAIIAVRLLIASSS